MDNLWLIMRAAVRPSLVYQYDLQCPDNRLHTAHSQPALHHCPPQRVTRFQAWGMAPKPRSGSGDGPIRHVSHHAIAGAE